MKIVAVVLTAALCLVAAAAGASAATKKKHPPASAEAERAAAGLRVPDPGWPLRLAGDADHVPRNPEPPSRARWRHRLGRAARTPARFEADSDGDGGSFIPAKPFAPGETVTVSTSLNIDGTGNGTFQFRSRRRRERSRSPSARLRRRVPRRRLAFRSRPDLAPAAVTITKRDPVGHRRHLPRAPGRTDPERAGMIATERRADLVRPASQNDAATDFREQIYRGQPVLTWWQGNRGGRRRRRRGRDRQQLYQRDRGRLGRRTGSRADLHEFELTPRGTALITACYPVVVERVRRSTGPTQEIVLDSVVQEIDVATGLVVFQWDSLDHVPADRELLRGVRPSRTPPTRSATRTTTSTSTRSQPDKDGNLLISARNTWAVYKVNRPPGRHLDPGRQELELQARAGSVVRVPARRAGASVGDQCVTMFDDGAGPPYVHSQSRALEARARISST